MDCEVIVRVKFEVEGQDVTVELDRANAEKLRAKLNEALPRMAIPTYVPQPYPLYPYPRPWWEGPIKIWCSSGSSNLKALSMDSTAYRATVE